MDKIAVLVPCYNEGKTIEKVVTDFKRVLPEAVIYVYDNNSTDGTAEIAAKAGAVVRHEILPGKRQCNTKNVPGSRCRVLSYGRRR